MTGPALVALPARANQITYSADVVEATAKLLREAPKGQGVAIDAATTLTKARARASAMRDLLVAEPHKLHTHGHAVPTGEKTTDKDGKEVDAYVPALSVNQSAMKAAKNGTPETPAETPAETPETPAEDKKPSGQRRRNR